MATTDVDSDRSFTTMQNWLGKCVENHTECQQTGVPILPTRVIDIGTSKGSESVRLLVTNGERADYVCLSYCWGSEPQPLTLTTENLPTLQESIDVNLLPQTIKDAIRTTIKIRKRYLWVDALCIIQNSAADKEAEIGRMGNIYNSAYVTIAAANGDNCRSGFLQDRTNWWSDRDGPPIPLPFHVSDDSTGTVFLSRAGPPPQLEPLYSRIWTLQEHLLSRRVLIYGVQQIFWVCNHETLLKVSGSNYDHPIANFDRLRKLLRTTGSPQKSNDQLSRHDWNALIKEYSARRQTVPIDRIYAFSIIAESIAHRAPPNYVAGFWDTSLLEDLLWRRTGDIRERPGTGYPSWSWLSIDSAIEPSSIGDHVSLAQIKAYEVVPRDPSSPYSLLSSARLTLFGHLKNYIRNGNAYIYSTTI
jgi:hypothetical protein